MTPSDVNIVKFYKATEEQLRNLSYSNSYIYQVKTPLNRFPPFDFVHPKTGGSIDQFDMVSLDDGSTTNILGALTSTGLVHSYKAQYDTYIYPGHAFSPLGLSAGNYYAIMGDDQGDLWYSDVIAFVDDYVDEMIKMEWGHDSEFCYPHPDSKNGEAAIHYTAPYKNRMYILNEIGKPSYQYQNNVSEQAGYNCSGVYNGCVERHSAS